MTRYAVVVVTDGNLFREAEQLLRDLARHCTGESDFYCFHRGLEAGQVAQLAAVPRLTLLPIPSDGARVGPLERHIDPDKSPLFYARFECWADRFAVYETVIYLDVDTIVLADLLPLAGADFLAAPQIDAGSPFLDEHDERLAELLRDDDLGRGVVVPANAGVFAVGRRWRGAEQRALIDRITLRYGPYLRVGDQSVLNLWMHANALTPTLAPAYNCQVVPTVGRPGGLRAVRHARVLHFNGFKLSNQRLAIHNARLWLRVPYFGRYLFAVSHFAMFRKYVRRPFVTGALELLLRARDRVRAIVGER